LGKYVDDAGYSAMTYGTITKDLKITTKTVSVTWEAPREDVN
jgi:hypothetical protein